MTWQQGVFLPRSLFVVMEKAWLSLDLDWECGKAVEYFTKRI